MTKDELIVKQQLEIEYLKASDEEFKSQKSEVQLLLFNIGAPLNDNYLGFNRDQKKVLHSIAKALEI